MREHFENEEIIYISTPRANNFVQIFEKYLLI